MVVEGLYYATSTITFSQLVSIFGEISYPCLVDNGLLPVASGVINVTVEGEYLE